MAFVFNTIVLIMSLMFFEDVIAQLDFNVENKEKETNQNDVINKSTGSMDKGRVNLNNVIIIKNSDGTAASKSGIAHLFAIMTDPIFKFITSPKVTSVLRNVGVCAVNGFMDIIYFYLPAPIIPLIATVAGMVIPFEPIVMLKQKMPVTSYRRAFQTAVNGFMKTFDKYKVDADYDDDPYMTRRFNRRFMNAPDDADKVEHTKL